MRTITAHAITWYHQILLTLALVFSAQRQWWGRAPGLRVLANDALPSTIDAPAHPPVALPAPDRAPQPVAPGEIEQLLDRIGARRLADLRELCDAFGRVYAAELAAKDEQIAELQRRADTAAREREALAARVQDLERVNTRQAAELRALSAEVAERLAVAAATLDHALAVPAAGREAIAPQPPRRNRRQMASTATGSTPVAPASPAEHSPAGPRRPRRVRALSSGRGSPPPAGTDTPSPEPQGHPLPTSPHAGQDPAIGPLLEDLGTRYIADLQALREAFEQVYAAELGAKDEQIAELQRQVDTGARMREALAARARDLERVNARQAAELRTLSAEIAGRLAVAMAALDDLTATPGEAQPPVAAAAA